MRKTNIPFRPMIELAPDITGLAATFAGRYRAEMSDGTWTPFPNPFVEVTAGVYSTDLTIDTAGTYVIEMTSTDPRVTPFIGYVVISDANIDDVAAAIQAAQDDIATIKTQVDLLDEETVNGIAAKVQIVDDKVTELKDIINDTEDETIISIRELLHDIQESGASRDSILAVLKTYTDDIEIMIRGDALLTDGSPNPFAGKTNVDIYGQVQDGFAMIHGALVDVKNELEADAHATRDLLVAKIDALKLVVDANATILGDAGHGLAALKTMLDTIDSNTAGGTQSIIDMLEDTENGLAAIKTAITTKLDSIETKVDGIAAAQTSTVRARLVL